MTNAENFTLEESDMENEADPLDAFKQHLSGGLPYDKAMIVKDEDGEPDVIGILLDVEMDPFLIKFGVDGEIQIQTDAYKWVSLSVNDCYTLVGMQQEAAGLWEKLDEYWHEDSWAGWEHLAEVPKGGDQ